MTKREFIRSLLAAGALLAAQAGISAAFAAALATVITPTPTACQFIESENGNDRGFYSTTKADCKVINANIGADRLARTCVLTCAFSGLVAREFSRLVGTCDKPAQAQSGPRQNFGAFPFEWNSF